MIYEDIHAACCFDRNMFVPAMVLAESLKQNHKGSRKINLYAFDVDNCLNEYVMSNINTATFSLIQCKPDFSILDSIDISESSISSKMTYCRLLIADHLKSINRIIYFDADVIANRDIEELYDTSLDGRTVGVCQDLEMIFLQNEKFQTSTLKNLDLKASDYFNAGVLLIDLFRWRSSNISEQLLALALDPPFSFKFADQDPLNIVFRDDKKFLDQRWNVLAGADLLDPAPGYISELEARQRELALTQPWIIHYAGNVKPWNHSDRQTSIQWLYWHVALKSSFAHSAVEFSNKINNIRAFDLGIGENLSENIKEIDLKHNRSLEVVERLWSNVNKLFPFKKANSDGH